MAVPIGAGSLDNLVGRQRSYQRSGRWTTGRSDLPSALSLGMLCLLAASAIVIVVFSFPAGSGGVGRVREVWAFRRGCSGWRQAWGAFAVAR